MLTKLDHNAYVTAGCEILKLFSIFNDKNLQLARRTKGEGTPHTQGTLDRNCMYD